LEESNMKASVKKTGRVLLAMTVGAAVSFGATLAFAPKAEASQVPCGAVECNASCQERGARLGKCVNGACTCF
jgi:hypothetical protein